MPPVTITSIIWVRYIMKKVLLIFLVILIAGNGLSAAKKKTAQKKQKTRPRIKSEDRLSTSEGSLIIGAGGGVLWTLNRDLIGADRAVGGSLNISYMFIDNFGLSLSGGYYVWNSAKNCSLNDYPVRTGPILYFGSEMFRPYLFLSGGIDFIRKIKDDKAEGSLLSFADAGGGMGILVQLGSSINFYLQGGVDVLISDTEKAYNVPVQLGIQYKIF